VDPETTVAEALALADSDGAKASLTEELEGADVVVLISGTGENAGAAEVVTREAYHRKIMTAGLALSDPDTGKTADAVVNILRPFASVLVVAQDHEFIPAMLSALRA
jgi:NAD(P)H-hydrate repair Nnr-like enzyme with NAD(P)H-hydrate epimerase domain